MLTYRQPVPLRNPSDPYSPLKLSSRSAIYSNPYLTQISSLPQHTQSILDSFDNHRNRILLSSATMSLIALPAELVSEISEYLASSYSLGSLAALNASSRNIHDTTLPVLYRSLVLVRRDPGGCAEEETPLQFVAGGIVPVGFQYTK